MLRRALALSGISPVKAKASCSRTMRSSSRLPIPLDVNVRAGGGDVQTDKNFNVNRLNAPAGSLIVPGVSTGATNLGSHATPADRGSETTEHS